MQKIIFIYLIAVNFIAYSLFHLDKESSKNKTYRISEKNLLLISAFGGTLGAWIGMNHFRHKTQKTSFRWKFFVVVILQMIFLYILFRKGR